MIEFQKIDFPLDCKISHHDLYDYDPLNAFNEEDSLKYLNEDLLQCAFPLDDWIIDLGWYGDINANKGEYRIQIIQYENWEIPFNTVYSKSIDEIIDVLTKILQYYTRTKPATVLDEE